MKKSTPRAKASTPMRSSWPTHSVGEVFDPNRVSYFLQP